MRTAGRHNYKDKVDLFNSGAEIIRLTPENADFCEKNGFVALAFLNGEEKTVYNRVSLRRCFPFELKNEYISVLDEEGREIGLIYSISDFPNIKEILETELVRRY